MYEKGFLDAINAYGKMLYESDYFSNQSNRKSKKNTESRKERVSAVTEGYALEIGLGYLTLNGASISVVKNAKDAMKFKSAEEALKELDAIKKLISTTRVVKLK